MTTISDLTKDVFIYFLSRVKTNLYKAILNGNTEIIRSIDQPLNSDSPLWIITGGEAINYYSSHDNKTPTKDIDCKLLFVGEYSIPKHLFAYPSLPPYLLHLRRYIQSFEDVLTENGFNVISRNLDALKEHIKTISPLWYEYFGQYADGQYAKMLIAGYVSRRKILFNGMVTLKDNSPGHIVYAKPDGTFTPLNISDLNRHSAQTNEWTKQIIDFKDGMGPIMRSFKLYMITTPYAYDGKDEDSFPYRCNDGIISDDKLYDIEQRLNTFHSNPKLLFDLYYDSITYMNMRRYLISLVGVCILVDNAGNKYIIQEGILDLFIDFSASNSNAGKYIYENKLQNGMIPNVIKKIENCGTTGYIKIPTLNWLIYDQTRMLYHSLRLQEVKDWSTEGVASWKPFEDGKQPKYFSKLKGLLTTYLNVLTTAEEVYDRNKDVIVRDLQNCTNETQCSPSFFISHIYSQLNPTNFIGNVCGGGIKKRHTKKTKQKKRNKTRHLKK